MDLVHPTPEGDLPERLVTRDRIHGDPGLELGAMGAAIDHVWEPHVRGGAYFRG